MKMKKQKKLHSNIIRNDGTNKKIYRKNLNTSVKRQNKKRKLKKVKDEDDESSNDEDDDDKQNGDNYMSDSSSEIES